jgi:hypothetical protein
MDTHVFLTNQAVRSLDGLTAFSALPNAPVLPYTPRRRRFATGLAALRTRRSQPARRLTPVTTAGTTAGNACA